MIRAHGLAHVFSRGKGKARREVRAVNGVDLAVGEGEVVGFLGPNGAGKTTTLRMLTTLLRPTAGTAVVAGHDVTRDPARVRSLIGYVSQSGATSGAARAGDEIVDHAMLYGLTRAEAERRGRGLLTELDLDGVWQRRPRTLSGGQRRRLDLVMGLVHRPRVVFLDEPTTGLDPQARANLWEHIGRLRAETGVTVFLTTHYLEEAGELGDRIIVIDRGRVVAADTPDRLRALAGGDAVELEVADPLDVHTAAVVLESVAEDGDKVRVVGSHVHGRIRRGGIAMPVVLAELTARGVRLAGIEVRRPTLDDAFLALTGRSLRDEG